MTVPAQISKVLKSNLNPQCCFTRHFKNFQKGGSGEHFYDPEVGMLLRFFALKGNDDLIWTLL